jgi:hypothetical protein
MLRHHLKREAKDYAEAPVEEESRPTTLAATHRNHKNIKETGERFHSTLAASTFSTS